MSHGLSLYLHNNQPHCFKLKRMGDKILGGKKPVRIEMKSRKKMSKNTSPKINPIALAKAVFLCCKVG